MEIENKINTQNIPNETLYLNNLNEKIPENELKVTLRNLFSQFGEILDIKVKTSIQCKGQAFIVYSNLESSIEAMKKIKGVLLFNKKINIEFARKKSDAFLKKKMLFNDEVYLKRKEDKKEERDLFYLRLKEKSKERVKKIPENQVNEVIGFNPALLLPKTNIKPEEKKKKNVMKEMLIKMGMEPCSKLFIDNVSEDTEYDEILPIFSKYPGFVKLNLIAEKNICFVEFENDNQASHALLSSNNTSLNGVELKVTFAKVL